MTALDKEPSGKSSSSSAAEISKQIKLLIQEVTEERADASRLDELRRVYGRLVASGELRFGVAAPTHPVAAKWQSFLLKNHKTMISQLCERIQLGKRSAIRCLWGVMAISPLTSSNAQYKHINPGLLEKWIQSMCLQESEEMDKTVRHMIETEFLQSYRDVRYFALGAISRLASECYEREQTAEKEDAASTSSTFAEKLLQFLMMIPVPNYHDDLDDSQYMFPPPKDAVPDVSTDQQEEEEDESSDDESSEGSGDESEDHDSGSERDKETSKKNHGPPAKRQKTEERKFAFQQRRAFRREYQKAWLAILKLNLSIASLKLALQFLPDTVFPNVAHPLRFSDFFMQAYTDHGSGVLGVLALDGLFILITEYELEYTDFYKQLYRLISPRVLHVKYRAKFMALLTNCLTRNEMLPAHLVAAFSKRLARCSLSSPPAGILSVLALVSNLLRKHPECASLIHRSRGTEMEDCFLPLEDDPEKSRALQSSLWELAVLERHYYPAVATLAKSIGLAEEAKAPIHDMIDFSTHTYKSLFDQERKKKAKTSLTFKEPASLFTEHDMFAGILKTG
jgi:U3 small nucleolar RNA-associated protein 19